VEALCRHELPQICLTKGGALNWKDDYSLGIEEIDNQHKNLLRLFNVAQDALNGEQGWSPIHYAILAIIDFTRFHFRFEEALMRLYAFPDYENHSKAHLQFLAEAERIVGESLRDRTREDAAKLFRDWLVNHILGADRDYARHILAGTKVVGATVPK